MFSRRNRITLAINNRKTARKIPKYLEIKQHTMTHGSKIKSQEKN